MNIANLCQRELVTIDSGASLSRAARLMREQHVGALVVTADSGERQHAVGIVTDRDLVVEVLAKDDVPMDMTVGRLSSQKLAGVPGSASVAEAVAAMERAGVRRLLVADEQGHVIGIVSADDLLAAVAAELGGLARALRSGIARESAERQAAAPPAPRPVFLAHGTPGMPGAPWQPLPRDHGAPPR